MYRRGHFKQIWGHFQWFVYSFKYEICISFLDPEWIMGRKRITRAENREWIVKKDWIIAK